MCREQPGAYWPVTRYVILLFVFNTLCYGYLRTNFRGFRRFLIHGNLCCFIIYTIFKYNTYLQLLVFKYYNINLLWLKFCGTKLSESFCTFRALLHGYIQNLYYFKQDRQSSLPNSITVEQP